MNTRRLPIAAVVLGCGCSHPVVTTYSGIIQRVESGEFMGYAVSPVSNSVSPLVHPVSVYVSVADAPNRPPRVVRIDFPDTSGLRPLGHPGDRVTFVIPGALPVNGHIAAEGVSRYVITQ